MRRGGGCVGNKANLPEKRERRLAASLKAGWVIGQPWVNVRNKANLQEARWTLNTGQKESYACDHGSDPCEKQSQLPCQVSAERGYVSRRDAGTQSSETCSYLALRAPAPLRVLMSFMPNKANLPCRAGAGLRQRQTVRNKANLRVSALRTAGYERSDERAGVRRRRILLAWQRGWGMPRSGRRMELYGDQGREPYRRSRSG